MRAQPNYYGADSELFQQALEQARAESEYRRAMAEKERAEAEAVQAETDAKERAAVRMASPYEIASPDFSPMPAPTPQDLAARAAYARENPNPVKYNPVVEQDPMAGDKNLIVRGNYSNYVKDQVARGLMSPPRTRLENPNARELVMLEELGPYGWKPTPLRSSIPFETKEAGGSIAVIDRNSGQIRWEPNPTAQKQLSEQDKIKLLSLSNEVNFLGRSLFKESQADLPDARKMRADSIRKSQLESEISNFSSPTIATNAPSTQTSDRFDSEADARAAGRKSGDVIYLRGIGKVRLQ